MKLKELETPALVADLDALEQNIARMGQIMSSSKAKLRPHYKSHKCVEIAKMQIAAGAKGITCAKVAEAEDLALAGIEDILIANQITNQKRFSSIIAILYYLHVRCITDCARKDLSIFFFRLCGTQVCIYRLFRNHPIATFS